MRLAVVFSMEPTSVPSSLPPTGSADWAGAPRHPVWIGITFGREAAVQAAVPESSIMELSWFGRTCVRLRGRDAVVVADPFPAVVGPTGRGITGEVVTFSHPDDTPPARAKGRLSRDGQTVLPQSLEHAFVLDGPGEYEVRNVLITGVRTYRDDAKGGNRGRQTAFAIEVDGVHTIHLGDIGHLLSEEKLGDIGPVDVACVPIGGALSATRAAELIAQLDPRIVVPMPVCEDEAACEEALATFFHEMGGAAGAAVPKLSITPSSLPSETTTVLLESRGKA
jgi:L-ascorbate metabolism protein UlaG (beta-lactamase superfamily)